MIPTRNGIAWEEPAGRSEEEMPDTNGEKRMDLFKYVIGGLVAVALLIGTYWAMRSEAANAKCDANTERIVRIETDSTSMKNDISEIKTTLKEIERLLRSK
jgi:hypothetical protein